MCEDVAAFALSLFIVSQYAIPRLMVVLRNTEKVQRSDSEQTPRHGDKRSPCYPRHHQTAYCCSDPGLGFDSFERDVIDHPLYSPELAPSDFHLFLYLSDKHLHDDEEVNVVV